MTWSHLGLDGTERIHRIVLHPDNSGRRLGRGARPRVGREPRARGLQDGRRRQELEEGALRRREDRRRRHRASTRRNPNRLFASMWQFRRWPDFFQSGGPGSGLYVHPRRRRELEAARRRTASPKGELGRIGLGASRARTPRSSTPWSRRRRAPCCARRTAGGRFRTVNDEPNVNAAAVLLRRPAGRPARTPTGLQPRLHGAGLRPTPARASRPSCAGTRSTATTTPCGSIRRIPSTSRRRRRRRGGEPRRRQTNWLRRQSAAGAVLPCRRRHGPAVQRLRRAAGQRLVARPVVVWRQSGGIRNHFWKAVGGGDGFDDPARPDRLDFRATPSGRAATCCAGTARTGEPREIKPAPPEGVEAALQLERRPGARSVRAADGLPRQPVPAQVDRPRRDLDDVSPGPDQQQPGVAEAGESGGLTRDAPRAENHTTIVTIAPSQKERGRSGSAPTTAACR